MDTETKEKTYHIKNSEKCFRFKPDAFFNHAPSFRGLYELVTFDENQNPKVLFVGAAFEKSIRDSLEAHADGTLEPKADDIVSKYPNLYFDFIAELDAKSPEDAQDIYWWLVQKHKPPYNKCESIAHSGRYDKITVHEED